MRVTSVGVVSNETEAIRFDLRNVASKSPYMVRTITGLDAEEIVAKFYGRGLTGQRFFNYVLKPRDIVMRIVLNPRFHLDETHSYIRDQLYRTISATRTGLITLEFYSGASLMAQIEGFITKFEVPYFSKTPELQLTVRCNDPMLRSPVLTYFDSTNLSNTNPVIFVDSASTAPHGFRMSLEITSTLTEFTIQDKLIDPEWTFTIVPPTDLLAGDILHFSSEFNDRQLWYERGGVITHLMESVDPSSIWPILFPGFNEFYFNDLASFDWVQIEYRATYWGV